MIYPSLYTYGKAPNLRTLRRIFQEWEYTLLAADLTDLNEVKLQWSPINVFQGRGQDDLNKCLKDESRLQNDNGLFHDIFKTALTYLSANQDYLLQKDPQAMPIFLAREQLEIQNSKANLHPDFRRAKEATHMSADYFFVIEMTASICGGRILQYEAAPVETFIL